MAFVTSLRAPGRWLAGVVWLAGLATATALAGPAGAAEGQLLPFDLEHDRRLYTRLTLQAAGPESPRVPLGELRPTDFVVVGGRPITDFALDAETRAAFSDDLGKGQRRTLEGDAAKTGLRKRLTISTYQAFPQLAIIEAVYTVTGTRPVRIDRWVSRRFLPANPPNRGARGQPAFWSYQSGSYEKRPDWVLPLRPGFRQQNFMGMNASDYGGGTPLSSVWRADLGVTFGHVDSTPLPLSLPVTASAREGAQLSVEGEVGRPFAPGESLRTPRLVVMLQRGDHFAPLAEYRRFMIASGMRFPAPPASAYEPIWCGWGYGRAVTREQITGTLGKAAELGFGWAVLDDGWQTAEGDWHLDPRKFPGGPADMKRLTAEMRAAGLRPMLWWAPLAADPGTQLLREHPDYLLLGPDGKPRKISWWDAFYLCPAYAPVLAHHKQLASRFLGEWGFEGLKLDGQHLNAAPSCHNPAHGHVRPEESGEQLPQFWQQLAESARAARPQALLELCPCGTAYAFHSMPHYGLPAASDPLSSWQIRTKGKTLKALLGARAPYFGDHVELSSGGDDFASTFAVGGVLGTQFTLPSLVGPKGEPRKYQLTPAREAHVRQWMGLHRDKQLARGEYLGSLYDIGFDRPEAHVVRTGAGMYYGFFARSFSGKVQLRGLPAGRHCARDYVIRSALGEVTGPVADLAVRFRRHLLLEVLPAPPAGCPP